MNDSNIAVSPVRNDRLRRRSISYVFLVNGFVFGVWVAHIPFIVERFDLSKSQLGVLLFLLALGAVGVMLLTGWLAAKIGTERIAAVTVPVYLLLLPMLFVVPSIALLSLLVVLFGAVNGAMDVAMNDQAVLIEQRYGVPIMSSFHAMFSMGGLFGAGSAVLALSVGLGPFDHAVIVCVALLLSAIIVIPVLLRQQRMESGVTQSVSQFVWNARLMVFAVAVFLVFLSEGVIADWSALYLLEHLNAGTGAGSAFAVFSLAMAIGRLSGDKVIRKFGRRSVVLAGGVLLISGLAVSLLTQALSPVLFGFALMGIGLANLVPIFFSCAGNLEGVPAAIGITTVAVFGYGGFLAGPPLIGFWAELVGLPIALMSLAFVGGVVIVVARNV